MAQKLEWIKITNNLNENDHEATILVRRTYFGLGEG